MQSKNNALSQRPQSPLVVPAAPRLKPIDPPASFLAEKNQTCFVGIMPPESGKNTLFNLSRMVPPHILIDSKLHT